MTVGDDFPVQQARIRQCLKYGREIGPAGHFYCMVAEDLLRRADKAGMGGDVVELLAIYKEMTEFKD